MVDENIIKYAMLALAGTTLLLLSVTTLLLLLRVLERPRWILSGDGNHTTKSSGVSERITAPGNGVFCSRCGGSLPGNPVRAITLVDQNYLVYKCKTCSNETLLSEG